jgi:hypothetical protein
MKAHYLLPTEPDNKLKYAKNEGYSGLEGKAVYPELHAPSVSTL